GRTPNPCVLCNTHIKWAALLKRADALGCDIIATGHHVKVREENGRYVLSKAKELTKDQYYVLWRLGQECLSRSIYPLGDYLKTEGRQLAFDMGYKELAKKAESYEICFVPDNDYRGFLKRTIPTLEAEVSGGNYVLSDGTIVGKHKGYPFYTIGQRKGLDIALGKPVYVTRIIPETNTVVLGEAHELEAGEMLVGGLNMVKYDRIREGMTVTTKIRYKDPGTESTLYTVDNKVSVHYAHADRCMAPGQRSVFIEVDDETSVGIICS